MKQTSVATGHRAEVAAAEYLVRNGYEILAMNWRRPICEIDIVARKADCLHFIEVKYREHGSQGHGLERVTSAKVRRLKFASLVFTESVGWRGTINIAAIEVSGPHDEITSFIESIDYDV